jgi:sulfate transport system ATP-binding protein
MSIAVSGVTKRFGGFTALDDVTIEVAGGSLTALLGPSGSGKSTLLRVIAGLERPDAGSVLIGDRDVSGRAPQERGVGFVFQHYAAFKHMTVWQNVAFGLTIRSRPKAEIHARVAELLELVQLEGLARRYPAQLSGGQRQRMGLARALAVDPEVLLLDEPFGALDARTRDTLQQDLAELCAGRERPVTTVMITNSVEEAILLSDRIVPIVTGPPASLGISIPVELERPRTLAQLAHDEQATHARAHVVAALTASMARRNRSVSTAATTALSTTEPVKEAL